ncbi:hypothetical protein ACH5RR_025282 [Cinchona calisaya]|uniref:Uncharacterized protein n=1 Tax=Cinchona calisaya TaxID=153742 RepID=A0ABD2Z2J1_9GENT
MTKPKGDLQNSQNQQLFQELDDLEEKWDTYKQINPRPHLRRCSTGGIFSDSIITSLKKKLPEISPRSLMSSLQENRKKSPILEDGYWKVRTNDLAAQEILRERRAALVSGKLKGRRLFEGLENIRDHEEICNDCFDFLQENSRRRHHHHEVRSLGSSYGSSSDDGKKFEDCGGCGGKNNQGIFELDNNNNNNNNNSCFCDDDEIVRGDNGKIDVKERRRVVVGSNFGGGRWMLAMAWFAIVIMVLTLGLISMSCNGGNLHEEKVILIPT